MIAANQQEQRPVIDPVAFYTTSEVGELIGFSRQTVVDLIQEGFLRATRGRRQYRVRGAELVRYISAAARRKGAAK